MMLYFNNLIVSLHPEKQSNSFNIHKIKSMKTRKLLVFATMISLFFAGCKKDEPIEKPYRVHLRLLFQCPQL